MLAEDLRQATDNISNIRATFGSFYKTSELNFCTQEKERENYRIKIKLKDDENLMEKTEKLRIKKGKAKNNFAYNKNTKWKSQLSSFALDLLILFNYKTLWS